MIEEKLLFKEVTSRICGDLELKLAALECHRFLREALPVDDLLIAAHQRQPELIRAAALVSSSDGVHQEALLAAVEAFPETGVQYDPGRQTIQLLNVPSTEPVGRETGAHFTKLPPSSLLLMPLFTRGERIGTLLLRAEGRYRYTDVHRRMISPLDVPFAVALANSERFREAKLLRERLAEDNRALQLELRRAAGDLIVGADFGLRRVMDLVRQVAAGPEPVLLFGERGVGKSVMAQALHQHSARRHGPFVRVPCAAIPDNLITGELFGHAEGSLSGADSARRGYVERAHSGTLFLDEVATLPPAAQEGLLELLRGGTFLRVGGGDPVGADVRVVAATSTAPGAALPDTVEGHSLWARLARSPIEVPPLRERRGDIPELAQHFLDRFVRQLRLTHRPALAPEGLAQLEAYDWPGNVRELELVIERALLSSGDEPLRFTQLDFAPGSGPSSAPGDAIERLDEVMAEHIRRVMRATGGRIQGEDGAAYLLGLNASTLRGRMRKLGIPFGRRVRY